jgi:hypothetical protein
MNEKHLQAESLDDFTLNGSMPHASGLADPGMTGSESEIGTNPYSVV